MDQSGGQVSHTRDSHYPWPNKWGQVNGFDVTWADPAPNGVVRTSLFFIVVKGYFSPVTPQGDVAVLDWIVLKPIFGGDNDDPAMVYVDTAGAYLGIYSSKGITLRGKVVIPGAPQPTPSATTSDTTSDNDSFVVGDRLSAKSDGLVLRTSPSLSSDTVAYPLARGSTLTIVFGPKQVDDDTWYLVKKSFRTKGWILADDIYFSG